MGIHTRRGSWKKTKRFLQAVAGVPFVSFFVATTPSVFAQQPPAVNLPPPPDFLAGGTAPAPVALPPGFVAVNNTPPPSAAPASPFAAPPPGAAPATIPFPSAVPPVAAPAPVASSVNSAPSAVAPAPGAAPYIPPVPQINEKLLVPPVEPGDAPRKSGHARGVDVPSSGKGLGPTSPLQTESGTEVTYESAETDNKRRKALEDQMRRKPNSRSVRYRPLDNDPTFDPLDKGYENWLKGVRTAQSKPADVDPEYEKFVKDISVLLFSLGEKQLPVETKEMLDKIPADTLKDPAKSLQVINPVAITHGATADPFPPQEGEVDETIGADVGLNINVTNRKDHVPTKLEMAYDALMSGQVEGAIALYKQVVEADPQNKQGLFGLATSYHRSGQLSDARATYIDLLKIHPDYWPAMNNFLVLAGEEAPENALKELRELEQINPEFSPIAAQIGMVYLQMGRMQDAVKYLSRAVILSPDNLGYRYNLAVVLDHAGYKSQAVRLYQQLLGEHEQGKDLPESRERIMERMAFIMTKDKYQ